MRIPFGKYLGEEIQDVPTTYFLWLLNNVDRLESRLRPAITAELNARRERVHRQQQQEGFDEDD